MIKEIIDLFKISLFNIPFKVDNETDFENELKKIRKKSQNVHRSNAGGLQFEISINDEFFKNFIKNLEEEANNLKSFYNIKNKLKISNFWLNINGHKDFNKEHIHPGGVLSGVFYFKVPNNSGFIKFKHPNMNLIDWYNCDLDLANINPISNNSEYILKPKKNMLLIFPSWINHSVDLNLNTEERISIAFNLCKHTNEKRI